MYGALLFCHAGMNFWKNGLSATKTIGQNEKSSLGFRAICEIKSIGQYVKNTCIIHEFLCVLLKNLLKKHMY